MKIYKISHVLVIDFKDKTDLYSSSVLIVASITICIKIRTIIIYNTYVEFLYMSMEYEV